MKTCVSPSEGGDRGKLRLGPQCPSPWEHIQCSGYVFLELKTQFTSSEGGTGTRNERFNKVRTVPCLKWNMH